MSEGTTNSNGNKELNVEETENIEQKMENAGYRCHINYMEAEFSTSRVQDKDGETAGGTSDTDNTTGTTAGGYTVVGDNGVVSFVQKIPDIAKGPKAPLKNSKNKDKVKKQPEVPEVSEENNKEDRDDK